MTKDTKRQTAKIYQFPAGGRAGLSIQKDADHRAAEPIQLKQPKIMLGGGCWYHDAAMSEGNIDNAS